MTSYIMIFGQPVQQMKRTHKQTDKQYGIIHSILCSLLEEMLSKIQLLTSPCSSCVLVCPSVIFKFLNHVTLLQILCEYDDELWGTT